MSNRLHELEKFAAEHYLTTLVRELGQAGVELAKRLHPMIREVFRAVDYSSISGSLTVFVRADGEVEPSDGVPVRDIGELTWRNLGTLSIDVSDPRSLRIWHSELDAEGLGESSLVYTFDSINGERFWVGGQAAEPRYPVTYPLFGLARFRRLEDALHDYGVKVARSSNCDTLQNCWREPTRLIWRGGPEAGMRRSLKLFLQHTLEDGNPDVNEEAPVNDKDPVDITVRWADSNRVALIEVKWLGLSGYLDPPRVTGRYNEDRATDALAQLADYLDLSRERTPGFDFRGYLAVFDGRRANVTATSHQCTASDGLAFRDKEPPYDPSLLVRHDIAQPVRFFCEPRFASLSSPSRSTRAGSSKAKPVQGAEATDATVP